MACGKWSIEIEDRAGRELRRLPTVPLIREAVETIDDLASDPFPAGVVKLRKHKDA